MTRVVVVGDAMLDVVVRAREPRRATSDTASDIRVGRGGSASNVAVALAARGIDVAFVAAVGDDVAGRFVAEDLGRAGVVSLLRAVSAATGTVVAVVDAQGQRAMLTDRGANRALSWDMVEPALAGVVDHVHVSGYTVLEDSTRELARAVLRAATAGGATTSLDVCSVGPLRAVTPGVFLDAGAGATFLFANEEEAVALAKADGLAAALDALAPNFEEVMVTRGPDGAITRRASQTWRVSSHADSALDSTGAGDAATGAYLALRLTGAAPRDALEAAMDAAAVVVGGLGSRGSSH